MGKETKKQNKARGKISRKDRITKLEDCNPGATRDEIFEALKTVVQSNIVKKSSSSPH